MPKVCRECISDRNSSRETPHQPVPQYKAKHRALQVSSLFCFFPQVCHTLQHYPRASDFTSVEGGREEPTKSSRLQSMMAWKPFVEMCIKNTGASPVRPLLWNSSNVTYSSTLCSIKPFTFNWQVLALNKCVNTYCTDSKFVCLSFEITFPLPQSIPKKLPISFLYYLQYLPTPAHLVFTSYCP